MAAAAMAGAAVRARAAAAPRAGRRARRARALAAAKAESAADKFEAAMGNMATEVDTKTPRYFEAEVVRVEQVTKSVRDVTVLAEVSRELVPLTQAYKQVGQRATVRAAGANGAGAQVPISSAPPPVEVYEESLDRLRGDIAASDSKVQLEPVSTLTEVTLRVDSARHRALYGLEPGDKVETGPFAGMGMSFRPMQFIFGYPTVLICANGEGISSAKALIECGASDRGLCFHMREAVRLYQREEQDGSLAYADRHANWANAYHVDVHPVKRAGGAHALQDAFDADDLEYDPDATAAIVFDGGDPGFKMSALKMLNDAGVNPDVIVQATKDGDAIFLENHAVTDDEKRRKGIA